MEELLMCSVCIERYHETERHPVLLPRCGHSFCRPCITMLISGGCIVCPNCRTNQRIDYAEKLPTEYTLLAIIHAQEHTKKETCERHAVKLSFWCKTCEIATCGECLFEDHPTHSHDVIRAAKYIADMKQNAQEVAAKFMDVLDDREHSLYTTIFSNTLRISTALRSITTLRKDMVEARELMKGIKEENSSIASATSLSEAAKFLGLKWNIQDANLYNKKTALEHVPDEIDIEKQRAKELDEAKQLEEAKELEKAKQLSEAKELEEAKQLEAKELDEAKKPEEEKQLDEAKQQEEAKELELKKKEKEKEEREIRKILRKSKTLSTFETLKDFERLLESKAAKEKIKSTTEAKGKKDVPEAKSVEKGIESSKKENDVKGNETEESENKSKNLLKTDDSRDKSLLNSPEVKVKEVTKAEDSHGEDKKLEQDSDDGAKSAEKETKDDKLSDLTSLKPRIKSSKRLHSSKKEGTASNLVENNEKTNCEEEKLAPIPEVEPSSKEGEKVEQSKNKLNESKDSQDTDEVKGNNEEDKEVSKTEETQNGTREAETLNADSGLSESSKINKKKDNVVERDPLEGNLTDGIQVPGFMVCVESSDGRLGEMKWGPQGLHVHCLQFTQVDCDIIIKDTLLNSLIPSKSPIVFMELSAEQTKLGRVYIKLWGHLRRAHNFLSLCIGDQGKSYLNTKFLQVYNEGMSGERILGGDYENNNGRGGRGLLDDLEWNGDYAMPMKAGMITAAGSGQAGTNSLFLLCSQSDPTRSFSCPFGLVCEGLKVLKDAIQQTASKQIWITDCGVLIIPPLFNASI